MLWEPLTPKHTGPGPVSGAVGGRLGQAVALLPTVSCDRPVCWKEPVVSMDAPQHVVKNPLTVHMCPLSRPWARPPGLCLPPHRRAPASPSEDTPATLLLFHECCSRPALPHRSDPAGGLLALRLGRAGALKRSTDSEPLTVHKNKHSVGASQGPSPGTRPLHFPGSP